MKVKAIGFVHMSGIGKESKKPYNIARLHVMTACNSSQNDTMTRRCAGFESMEIDVTPESAPIFMGANYPCELDLLTDTVPRSGRLQTIVTGISGK